MIERPATGGGSGPFFEMSLEMPGGSTTRRTVLSVLLICAAAAQAGVIRHDRADSLYTALAQQSRYDSVGMFEWSSGPFSGLASGSLITSDWVLTAGHVVEDVNPAAMTFTVGGQVYNVAEYIAYPGYTGDSSAGNDLALVRLTAPVTNVTPAVLYTQTDEVDRVTVVVGFGETGTGLTGNIDGTAGTKRAGENLIGGLGSVIGYSDNIILADLDYPDPGATGKAICLDLEYLAAPGDSGGGWFVEVSDQTYLAGVTSFGYATDGFIDFDYGDIMGATRVSLYADWIWQAVKIPGDANLDGLVDGQDFTFLKANFGLGTPGSPATWAMGNFNGDYIVDGQDFTIMKAHFGESEAGQPVPEPATMLLALGAWAMLPRMRRKPRVPGRL